jgi:hypothetical protein
MPCKPVRQALACAMVVLFAGPLQAAAGLPAAAPRVLDPGWVDYADQLLSGGPGKDGIPSIDKPEFIAAGAVGQQLNDQDIVFGVYHQGQARAYPQKILVWHELVNDQLGGDPLSISYCPLTATAVGFRRGDTQFGVSGKLLNSNVVMYDRASDSFWSQITGVAIDGPARGQFLDEVRVIWTTWGRWKSRHPQTQVLSRQTGAIRNYDADPYGSYNPLRGYYSQQGTLFPIAHRDSRLHAKQMVLGFRTDKLAVAVDRAHLQQQGYLRYQQDGEHFLIIHDPQLDTGWVYRSFMPAEFDPQQLQFGAQGPRAPGLEKLQAVNAFDAMWFAWYAFYPMTVLLDGQQTEQ